MAEQKNAADTTRFSVSFWPRGHFDTNPPELSEKTNLDNLADLIRQTSAKTKDKLPFLKLARMGNKPNPNPTGKRPSYRHDGNVEEVWGVEYDYDEGSVSLEEAERRLFAAHIDAVICDSPRWGVKGNCWHAFCPTDTPLSPSERLGLWEIVNAVFDGEGDQQLAALSQGVYIGSAERVEGPDGWTDGQPVRVLTVEGDPINHRRDLPKLPKRGRSANGQMVRATATIQSELIGLLEKADEFHPVFTQYASGCADNGVSEAACTAAIYKALRRAAINLKRKGSNLRLNRAKGLLESDEIERAVSWAYGQFYNPTLENILTAEEAAEVEEQGRRSEHEALATMRDPRSLPAMSARYGLLMIGGKAVIVDRLGRGPEQLIELSSFRTLYSNRRINGPNGKEVRLGSFWLDEWPNRREHPSAYFRPLPAGEPIKEPATGKAINLWTGYCDEPQEGDVSCFLDLVWRVVAQGNSERFHAFMTYVAHMYQYPADKPGVCIVLKGEMGAGKDTVIKAVCAPLDPANIAHYADVRHLTGDFNGELGRAHAAHFQEAMWGGDKASEGVFMSLITTEEMMINEKNKPKIAVTNYTRFFLSTNSDWAVPAKHKRERRYQVFDCSDELAFLSESKKRAFWRPLHKWIMSGPARSAILHCLMSYKRPDGADLRDAVRTIIKTKGLAEQKVSNLYGLPRFIFDTLSEGRICGRAWSRETTTCVTPSDVLCHANDHISGQPRKLEKLTHRKLGEWMRDNLKVRKDRSPASFEAQRPEVYYLPPLSEARSIFADWLDIEGVFDWEDDSTEIEEGSS